MCVAILVYGVTLRCALVGLLIFEQCAVSCCRYNPDEAECGAVVEMSGDGVVLQTLPALPDGITVASARNWGESGSIGGRQTVVMAHLGMSPTNGRLFAWVEGTIVTSMTHPLCFWFPRGHCWR